jgi:lipopolysaccharide export LptBFGC system permease protein LptF
MMGIAMSIIAFFVYFILSEAAAAFGSTGRVNPYIVSWIPNLVFGVGGLALLWYEEH